VVEGGVLRQIFRTLPISCLPKDIPQAIDFDVTEMNLLDVRKVSDLTLPEGVSVRLPIDQTVIAVDAAVAEEEEEGAVVEGAEGEAAAAPAEGAEAPAKAPAK
jgi:large subunit ribosomal protein L25